MTNHKLDLPSLTVFRFVTAFIVFIFHCNIHLDWETGVKIFDRFFRHGAVFMTGFFVLSGFIMTHVYQNYDFKSTENIRSFYLKRLAKIYPTYLVATIAYFCIFRDFTSEQYWRVIINNIFLVQSFFPSMFHIGINGGTWSLTVEMFLYLLFPYILIVTRNPSKLLGLGIILAAIVSFNVMIEKSDTVYANPVFRIPDFLCGVGFYFACHRIKKHSLMIPLTLLLIFASVVYLGSGSYQYMRGHVVTAPLFGLWIAAMSTSQSLIYRNKILQYLGLISYSFYLWQFAAIELGRQMIKSNPDLSIHLIVVIVFIANVIISAISYHLLEENARKFILRKFNLT